jgi:hypothetical protein
LRIIFSEVDIKRAIELAIKEKGLEAFGVVSIYKDENGIIEAAAFIKNEEK